MSVIIPSGAARQALGWQPGRHLWTGAFGERPCPPPAAVIMEYTGLSDVTGKEPPTYNCVGTADGIAWYGTMKRRIEGIRAHGTDADIEIFPGCPMALASAKGPLPKDARSSRLFLAAADERLKIIL